MKSGVLEMGKVGQMSTCTPISWVCAPEVHAHGQHARGPAGSDCHGSSCCYNELSVNLSWLESDFGERSSEFTKGMPGRQKSVE